MTHNISNSSFFDPNFNFKPDSLFVCFYHSTAIGTMTNTGPFFVSLLVHSSCYYKIWKQPCVNQSPALGCVPTSTWQALAKILICGWFLNFYQTVSNFSIYQQKHVSSSTDCGCDGTFFKESVNAPSPLFDMRLTDNETFTFEPWIE